MEAGPTIDNALLRRAKEARDARAAERNRLREEQEKREKEEAMEEEEESPILEPRLPLEMQVAMVERFERAGPEPVPNLRLVEAVKAWREVYRNWQEGRRLKIERPPPEYLPLALARLFVSPRFKLISAMNVRARGQILDAYDLFPVSTKPDVLLLFRAEVGGWRVALAREDRGKEPDRTLQTSEIILRTTEGLIERKNYDIDLKGPDGIVGVRYSPEEEKTETISDLLLYGRARFLGPRNLIDFVRSYELEILIRSFFPLQRVVWRPRDVEPDELERLVAEGASLDATPTAAMLGWRSVIVVVRVKETSFADDHPGEALVVLEIPAGGKTERLRVDPPSDDWTRSIEDLFRSAVSLAKRAVAERPDLAHLSLGLNDPTRLRARATWQGLGERSFVFYENGRPTYVEKDGPIEDFARFLESTCTESALESLARHPDRWNYSLLLRSGDPNEELRIGSTPPLEGNPRVAISAPHAPRRGGSTGIVIMPAPFFFFFDEARGDAQPPVLDLFRGRFEYDDQHLTFFRISSEHVLTHQPSEFIYLPDDLNTAELADLALLQRRDIPERATAPLRAEGVSLI